jgi:hypothetical protein
MENLMRISEIAGLMRVTPYSAKRALRNQGIDLVPVKNTFAAERDDVLRFLAKRLYYSGRGRPKGSTAKVSSQKNHIEFIQTQLEQIRLQSQESGIAPEELANILIEKSRGSRRSF